MELQEARLDLLKLELTILASKINGTVDRLWKIRMLGITLWSGAIAIGIGATTGSKQVLPALILISGLIPVLFLWIDATYNAWYEKFILRETEICCFINADSYILKATGNTTSFADFMSDTNTLFPAFDITGKKTFGNDKDFAWETSIVKNLYDIRPAIIYGGQLIITTTLVQYQVLACWIQNSYLVFCFGVFLVIGIVSIVKKRQIYA